MILNYIDLFATWEQRNISAVTTQTCLRALEESRSTSSLLTVVGKYSVFIFNTPVYNAKMLQTPLPGNLFLVVLYIAVLG